MKMITKKINQPTIQSCKAKESKIEIRERLLITTLFLEIKIKSLKEKMAFTLSFNIHNPNLNILQDYVALNRVIPR